MDLMYKTLPTPLARRVAEGVGLLAQPGTLDYQLHMNMLIQFEQLSIVGSFNAAKTAYYGHRLTKKQLTGLKLLYEHGRTWMTGHTISHLNDMLIGGDKETVAAAKLILETLIPEGQEAQEEQQKFIVNVTQRVKH